MGFEGVIDEAVRVLKELGASRVVKRGKGDCVILAAEYPEDVVLVAVSRGSYGSLAVAKVVPSMKAGSVPWVCEYLDYVPHGLYAVIKSLGDVRVKLGRKVWLVREYVKGLTAGQR